MKQYKFLRFLLLGLILSFGIASCSDEDDYQPEIEGVFHLEEPEDGLPRLLDYGQSIEILLVEKNITDIEAIDIPTGWKIEADEVEGKIKVTAPNGEKDSDASEVVLKLKAKDKDKKTVVASTEAYTLDYSHPLGTFVVIEGNMSNEDGNLAYFDQHNRKHEDVYENANG